MLKAFIGKPIEKLPLIELLRPNFQIAQSSRWTERYVQLQEPVIEIVEDIKEADFIILPHNYNLVRKNREFLNTYEQTALLSNKKLVIFFPGDLDEEVLLKNAIIFRNSQYRSKMKSNEIILPGYVEDLGAGKTLKPLTKRDKPNIGFCGWADFSTFNEKLKFTAKSLPISVVSIFKPDEKIRQRGLWWRRKILVLLSKSDKIKTNFIIRKSYSGNEKTIALDPEQAKREYVDNILSSDFTLCIKGDGNYSTRFYEILSLGRIPLLIDTECVMPFENEIDYSTFILKVDWKDADKIDSIVSEFYKGVSEEKLQNMQLMARDAFQKYLKLDSYFKYIFTKEYTKKLGVI